MVRLPGLRLVAVGTGELLGSLVKMTDEFIVKVQIYLKQNPNDVFAQTVFHQKETPLLSPQWTQL